MRAKTSFVLGSCASNIKRPNVQGNPSRNDKYMILRTVRFTLVLLHTTLVTCTINNDRVTKRDSIIHVRHTFDAQIIVYIAKVPTNMFTARMQAIGATTVWSTVVKPSQQYFGLRYDVENEKVNEDMAKGMPVNSNNGSKSRLRFRSGLFFMHEWKRV